MHNNNDSINRNQGNGDNTSRNYPTYPISNDTDVRKYPPVAPENKILSRQSSSARLLDSNRQVNPDSPGTSERRFVPQQPQQPPQQPLQQPPQQQQQFVERQFEPQRVGSEQRFIPEQNRQYDPRQPINENRNFDNNTQRINQQKPIPNIPQQQQQRQFQPENPRQFDPSLRQDPIPQQQQQQQRPIDNQNNVPRPLARQTSQSLLQSNRPPDLIRPISDNIDRPIVENRPQIRPEVPRPVDLQRQQSSANLQPQYQQPPLGASPPKQSFRQLVNKQLIPNRNNDPRIQNVMGIEQSRLLKEGDNIIKTEDPNRLIKLARSEMADNNIVRQPSTNTDINPNIRNDPAPPVRKIIPPETMKQPSQFSEPPKALPESTFNSTVDLKSEALKTQGGNNMMPSGKPVAKAVTITVSGKLPAAQSQPINQSQPIRQVPSGPIKKPQDGQRFESDMLKRTDSSFNMDPQRPRQMDNNQPLGNIPDERFERMDSSGNLLQDRRIPPELNRNDSNNSMTYRKPNEDFNNDSMRPFPRGPDLKSNTEYFNENGRSLNEDKLMDSRTRPVDFKRVDSTNYNRTGEPESMLTSLAYTSSNEAYKKQSEFTGDNSYDSEYKQRPSELNLSGNVATKNIAGRVGWKNGEENVKVPERKISGRSTPTEKGVSFVETPRKKSTDGKIPGTWCALTGRFIPIPFDRPKSPDPRPKTPTTPKKKRMVGSYCPKTGRYIPPEKEQGAFTPRTPDKSSEFKPSNSGRSTPDTLRKGKALTPREDFHVSFIDEDETPEVEFRKISDSGRSTPNFSQYARRVAKKPLIAFGSVVPEYIIKTKERSKVRRTKSNDWMERRYNRTDGDHDSGVDEATQGHANTNGEAKAPATQTRRAPSKIPAHKRASTPGTTPGSPAMSPLKSPNRPHPLRSASLTPEPSAERKKLPMNKIQVGTAASPNLKAVRSKIGSLENTTHKPGGGKVHIENRKIDFSTTGSRITAKNDTYQPGGGDKKIESKKLAWNAKSKIGSLENATHKAGGGEKKIETVKLDFKNKATSKVGSKDNIKHTPGGGAVKKTTTMKKDSTTSSDQSIENQKLDFKVTSKIGSLANVKHRPGGGDVKIFDDKDYLKQMQGTTSGPGSEGQASGTHSPLPTSPPPGMSRSPMSPTAATS